MDWLDIVWLVIVVVLSIANALLNYRGRLPRSVRRYLKKIPKNIIDHAVYCANSWYTEDSDGKRRLAVSYLKDSAAKLGIALPDSIANLLVEWAYHRLKPILDKRKRRL